MPVPLVTVEDIEAALGRPLTDSESARAARRGLPTARTPDIHRRGVHAPPEGRRGRTSRPHTGADRLRRGCHDRRRAGDPLQRQARLHPSRRTRARVRGRHLHGRPRRGPRSGSTTARRQRATYPPHPRRRRSRGNPNDRDDGTIHADPPVRHMGSGRPSHPLPRRPGARGCLPPAPRRACLGDGRGLT